MKSFIKKNKDELFGCSNSIRNKIIKDSFKFFLIYVIIFISFLSIHYYLKYGSAQLVIDNIISNLLSTILTFIIIMFSFKTTLRKHLFLRFKEIQQDMKKIKKGDFSKRLRIKSFDEIDELAYFTNGVLDEFEKKLDFEKKYSLTDPLTLCYNRRALNLSFIKINSKVNRGEKISFSILLLDLDNFKKVNDSLGHDVGDKVLKNIAIVIRNILRKEDNLYRLGGEEFLINFSKLPKTKEKELIKRLQTQIRYQLKKKIPEVKQEITISGGFIRSKEYDLTKEDSLDKMIKDADKLLYKAKTSGKDKVLFND